MVASSSGSAIPSLDLVETVRNGGKFRRYTAKNLRRTVSTKSRAIVLLVEGGRSEERSALSNSSYSNEETTVDFAVVRAQSGRTVCYPLHRVGERRGEEKKEEGHASERVSPSKGLKVRRGKQQRIDEEGG